MASTPVSPGTASPLGGRFIADPRPVLDRLRESCPVTHTTSPAGQEVWVVTREADVRAALLNPRLSLAREPVDVGRPHRALDMTLVNYDPPDHTRIRRLAAPALSAARLAPWRERVAELAEGMLDGLGRRESLAGVANLEGAEGAEGADRAEHLEVELLADFAQPFAFGVMCEVFGIAEAHRPALRAAMDTLADAQGHSVAEKEAAVSVLDSYVRWRVDLGASADRGAGVIGEVIRTWTAGNETPGAAPVSREELLDLIAMLLLAGYDSTVQMLALAVLALCAEPDGLAPLAATGELSPSAVDELLRMDTPGPFATTRHALSDVRIAGTVIPAGSQVLLSLTAANHDHRTHTDPQLLRLDRTTRSRQLSFGLGPHYCLGSALARMTLAAALGGLARRWPGARVAVGTERLR
ncbi:cytochrome P450, partial [Catenulispora pinisilvae]|uniref:cytochrome P450 n=1 Tax=Catenulispora pinisilvae TaxID=2705253 RepID=UPI0018928160